MSERTEDRKTGRVGAVAQPFVPLADAERVRARHAGQRRVGGHPRHVRTWKYPCVGSVAFMSRRITRARQQGIGDE